MSRITTLFAIIALAMATAVVAQEERPQPRPEQQQQQAEKTFMGEVASIDEDAKTLTVKEMTAAREPARPDPTEPQPAPGAEAAAKSLTFHVDAQTEITKQQAAAAQRPEPGQERPGMSGKEELELQDLNEGDRVSVKYTESAGKHHAKSIEVIRKTTS